MTNSSLLPRRRRVPAALRPLAQAVGSGILLGLMSTACVVTIHDGGHDQEECFDEYGDCMDDAESASEFAACETELDVCLESFADDEAGDGDGDGDSGDGDGDDDSGDDAPPPRADLGTGDDDTDTTGGDPDCFEQNAICIGEAQTVQDVDACKVLFDHCIDPDGCDAPDCNCPLPE
jgi:hypothetical protein